MMASLHLYFGIENLALSGSHRQQLILALDALGPGSDDQPARLNHRRVRLDQNAAIYEALFPEHDITPAAFVVRLADLFDVNPMGVTVGRQPVIFASLRSLVLTFRYGGTDYFRAVMFGFNGQRWPSWKESRLEARAYLVAHLAEWKEEG